MEKRIKRSVATLLSHIIKLDHRDLKKEDPIFCKMMGMDFNCDANESKTLLREILNEEYDINEHIDNINDALKNDCVSKMHILEQLNHIIYSDRIQPHDYEEFEKIKDALLFEKPYTRETRELSFSY